MAEVPTYFRFQNRVLSADIKCRPVLGKSGGGGGGVYSAPRFTKKIPLSYNFY